MKQLYKKTIRFIGLLIFCIVLYKTDWNKFVEVFSTISAYKFLPIYLLIIPRDIIAIYRWHILLKRSMIFRKFTDNIQLYYSGFLMGLITPGRVGELYRTIKLHKEGHSRIKTTFLIFLLRFFDITLIFLISILSLPLFLKYPQLNVHLVKNFVIIGLLILTAFYVPVFLLKRQFSWLIFNISKYLFKNEITRDEIMDNLSIFNFKLFSETAILTFLFWSIHFFHIYLFATILEIGIPFVIMFLILAIVTLAAALPITMFGLGTREFALINILMLFGIAKEKSLALSLMIYTSMIITALISTIFWNMEHKGTK